VYIDSGRDMLFCKNHISRRRHIFWAMIARVVAFVFLFTLLVPHPAPAGIVLDASSPAIMTSLDGSGSQPGGTADYDLAKHVGCSCHITAPVQHLAATIERIDFCARYMRSSDTQLLPGPSSLPFKPPIA